jgi:DNA polymerase III delta prime subunit
VETIRLGAFFARRRLMEELLEGVARHAGERRANRLTLYTVDRWGDEWRLADSKPRRALDSVVLDEGVATLLHDDIHEFFGRREWYAQMGIPWRRGYLLYGPPGTGKTSAAYALAGELRLKLCALSLTNPKLNDNVMADLLQRTPPRSLILIEDIDAFFNAREKQDTRMQISFSGLLNALDGVGAQEGRIIVLTTNHREKLDPALIRPGRIDLEIELGKATAAQLQGLLLRFHPEAGARIERLAADYPPRTLSPAQIQQILITADNLDEAEAGLRAAFVPAVPRSARSHRAHTLREGVDPRPVGEVDHGVRVGRSVGDEHDEADHLPVEEPVARVVQLAGEDVRHGRPPAHLLQELEHVGVGLGAVLLRLARHDVDAEEGAGPSGQQGGVLVGEGQHVRPVLAVADAGADDDLVVARDLGRADVFQRPQRDAVAASGEPLLDALADRAGVAVDGGAGDEDAGHGAQRAR